MSYRTLTLRKLFETIHVALVELFSLRFNPVELPDPLQDVFPLWQAINACRAFSELVGESKRVDNGKGFEELKRGEEASIRILSCSS